MYYITDKSGYVIAAQDSKPTESELKAYSNIGDGVDNSIISCNFFDGTEETARINDCLVGMGHGMHCQCGFHYFDYMFGTRIIKRK